MSDLSKLEIWENRLKEEIPKEVELWKSSRWWGLPSWVYYGYTSILLVLGIVSLF